MAMKETPNNLSHHVKNSLTLLAIALLLLAAPLSVGPVPIVSNVFAQGSGPELLIQPAVQPLATTGSTVTFNVSVANMPMFAGWNIYVRSNPGILNPMTITLGTFMPSGSESSHCINGVGSSCDGNDGRGIAHDGFASFSSVEGSGTLFTITYTAVAGPGTGVNFPESMTGNNGLNSLYDMNGINITGVPETSATYGTFFDFSISNSGNVTVVQGSTGANTIAVTLTSGGTQPVTLSATGFPTSTGFSFAGGCTGSPTCTASPSFSTTLGVSTLAGSSATPTGDYTITVTATGGGQTHTTTFTMTVRSDQSVGGVIAPIDKLTLLSPFIALIPVIGAVSLLAVFALRQGRPGRKNP